LGRLQASSRGQRSEVSGQKPAVSPFQRFSSFTFQNSSLVWGLVAEKIPLFLLSAASCVATLLAQKKVIEANLQMSFVQRTANAVISYVAYLGEMFWPSYLSVSHPYSEGYRNLSLGIASMALLLIISALCLLLRKRYPFLLTGWFWYLGILVPMIGLVQVSSQARPDRYTYLSQIGLYIMVSWGALTLIAKWRPHRVPFVSFALVLIIALGVRSYAQTYYWRDTETLWRHAVGNNTYDYIAHDNLGYTLLQKGHLDEAIAEYEKAIAIKPDYTEAHNNLGNVLLQKGLFNEAVAQYRRALDIDPDDPQIRNDMGNALLKMGKVDEAIELYRKAATLGSNFAEIHYNLGSAYIVKGDWNDAIASLQTALKIDSNYPEAHNKLGIAFGATGRINEAIKEFKEALRLNRRYAQAHFNLGYILTHIGNRQEGIAHLQEAVQLKPDYTEAKDQLRELGVPISP